MSGGGGGSSGGESRGGVKGGGGGRGGVGGKKNSDTPKTRRSQIVIPEHAGGNRGGLYSRKGKFSCGMLLGDRGMKCRLLSERGKDTDEARLRRGEHRNVLFLNPGQPRKKTASRP